mmetsp:Transcript_124214/g.351675  ORF Transcript_124214/g.351675 Transcript_124214/m.351675 type:complete len:349 (+) Transcript_124214:346-1392(+)
MSFVWKAPPVLMTRACKAFWAIASLQRVSMAPLVPPQVKPEGKRKFATRHSAFSTPLSSSDFFASAQSLSILFRSRPATEHMAWGTISVAFCMASARICTSRRPSSALRTPAATMATYSPRERPATAWGRSYTSGFESFSTSMAARSARNMMGWQYLVSAILSSGPLRHSSFGSQPRISVARARISLTTGRSQASLSIPTYCEPCPGKSSAAGTGGFFFSAILTVDLGRSDGIKASSSGVILYGTSYSPIWNQYFRSFFMSLSSRSDTMASSPGHRCFTRRYSCAFRLFFSVSSPLTAWKHHSISGLCSLGFRQIVSSGVKPLLSGTEMSTPFSTSHCRAQAVPNWTQ